MLIFPLKFAVLVLPKVFSKNLPWENLASSLFIMSGQFLLNFPVSTLNKFYCRSHFLKKSLHIWSSIQCKTSAEATPMPSAQMTIYLSLAFRCLKHPRHKSMFLLKDVEVTSTLKVRNRNSFKVNFARTSTYNKFSYPFHPD